MKLQNYKTMTLTFLTFSSLLPVDNIPQTIIMKMYFQYTSPITKMTTHLN